MRKPSGSTPAFAIGHATPWIGRPPAPRPSRGVAGAAARGGSAVRRPWARAGGVLVFVGALLTAPAAQAQLLSRFEPAERGSRFFTADSLELDGRVRAAAGVVASYATRLRTHRGEGPDRERSELVESSLWLHPGASVTIAPGARFALDLPVAVQSGDPSSLDGVLFRPPDSPRLGDLRASFDLRLLGRTATGFDDAPPVRGKPGGVLAAGLSIYLPTGSADAFTGDGHVRFAARVGGSFKAGPIAGAMRVSYMYRRDDMPAIGGVAIGSEAQAAAALGVAWRGLLVGPEVQGATFLHDPLLRRGTPVEGLFGARVTLGAFRVGLGVGTLLTAGLGAAQARGVASIEWAPPPAGAGDRDHDGVVDAEDLCPETFGSALRGGCPAPPRDEDGDGVLDADDACPQQPGLRTGDPMTHGCPDVDHDGVPDPIDACPSVPGVRSVLPRFHGCPADADGDGVPDTEDACPSESGPATGDYETTGCPVRPPPPPPPDRDGDGVPDDEDACPDEPGKRTDAPTTSGCPAVQREGERLVLREPLAFEDGRRDGPAVLTAETDAMLADVASFLVERPEIARVEIAIRGPGRGRAAREAKAVVDRLVAYGVSARRLIARGAEVRARRVELRVLPK